MTRREADRLDATIELNGETMPLQADSVAELLAGLGVKNDGGVAVAVNGEVVPRSGWSDRALCPGDRIEVLGAVQGG